MHNQQTKTYEHYQRTKGIGDGMEDAKELHFTGESAGLASASRDYSPCPHYQQGYRTGFEAIIPADIWQSWEVS